MSLRPPAMISALGQSIVRIEGTWSAGQEDIHENGQHNLAKGTSFDRNQGGIMCDVSNEWLAIVNCQWQSYDSDTIPSALVASAIKGREIDSWLVASWLVDSRTKCWEQHGTAMSDSCVTRDS